MLFTFLAPSDIKVSTFSNPKSRYIAQLHVEHGFGMYLKNGQPITSFYNTDELKEKYSSKVQKNIVRYYFHFLFTQLYKMTTTYLFLI